MALINEEEELLQNETSLVADLPVIDATDQAQKL